MNSWGAVIPQFNLQFVSQFSGSLRKGMICHDSSTVTVIKTSTAVSLLDGLVANGSRIIFALDAIFQTGFIRDNINSLVTAWRSDRYLVIAFGLKKGSTAFFKFKSILIVH